MPSDCLQNAANFAQVVLATISIPTPGYLIWYTVETKRLRKIAQSENDTSNRILKISQDQIALTAKQTMAVIEQVNLSRVQYEFSYRPLVTIQIKAEVVRTSTIYRLHVANLGNGPAFEVGLFALLGSNGDAAYFKPISILRKGEDELVEIARLNAESLFVAERQDSVFSNQIELCSFGEQFEVGAAYRDMSGQSFRTTSEVSITPIGGILSFFLKDEKHEKSG